MQPEAIWPRINAPLQPNEIKVWLFETPAILSSEFFTTCRCLLTPAEQAYADQKPTQAQRNYVVKQAFLRHVLAQYHSNCAATSLSFTHNPHGKPSISSPDTALRFNLSHSGQWHAVAVGLARDIGVDIEAIKPTRRVKRIAQHYFHPQEKDYLATFHDTDFIHPFYSIWTLKEALVKAAGVGMSQPFNQFSVIAKSHARTQAWQLRSSISLCTKSWVLQHCKVSNKVSLAIAVEGSLKESLDITICQLRLATGGLYR